MKGDMVEKKVMLIDGEEAPGLISLDEYVIEDGVVEVPGRDKTVPVRDGVKKVPGIGGAFKIQRDSPFLKFLENWYYLKEYKEVIIKRTDGKGKEFAREMWPNTELSKLNSPAYDASAPVTAQAIVNFLPEDVIPMGAEG